MIYRGISIWIVLLAIFSGQELWAAKQRLLMVISGHDYAYVCDTLGCVAGGREVLGVRVWPWRTVAYPSLEEGWPQYLTIEAGFMDRDRFLPDLELLESLDFSRLIYEADRRSDSLANSKGELSGVAKSEGLKFYFGFSIPDEYAGQRLYLRGIYDSPESGRLVQITAFDVVSACDEKARQISQGSYVREQNFRGNHERAVQIADSLVQLGWHDFTGLVWAANSAGRLNRAADVLRFMDMNYYHNGKFRLSVSQPATAEQVRQDYENTRQKLLGKIAEQEEQQR